MRWVLFALLGVVAGPACSSEPQSRDDSGSSDCAGGGRPILTRIEPNRREVDEATPVSILGECLVPRSAMEAAGEGTLDAELHVTLSGGGGEDSYALEGVRLVDPTRLEAVVPAGLPPGEFTLSVVTPTGERVRLDEDADGAPAFTNALRPDIRSIDPTQATTDGGVVARIWGRYFVEGTTAAFGTGCPDGPNVSLTEVSREGEELLRGTVPAMPEGTVDVFVTSRFGFGCLPGAFAYVPVPVSPVICSVEPDLGPLHGGIELTVRGDGFSADAEVRVGGKLLVAAEVDVTAGTVTGQLPAGDEAGMVSVELTIPGVGCDALEPPESGFLYVAPPTVHGVAPGNGSRDGGTRVLITGTGFRGEVGVRFGGLPATEVDVSDQDGTVLAAVTPSGRGVASVDVTAVGGTGSLAGGFRYNDPPQILAVEPAEGREQGGQAVVVRGTGLDHPELLVSLGGRQVIPDPSRPAGADSFQGLTPVGSGTVTLSVTSPDGLAFEPGAYTYRSPPQVTSIEPRVGRAPLPGQDPEPIEIRGTSLLPDTVMRLGDSELVDPVVDPSGTLIRGGIPAGAGLVGLRLEHAFGQTHLPDVFRYEGAADEPSFDRIHPEGGPEGGGNRFWIQGWHLGDGARVRIGHATVRDAVALDGRAIVGTVPPGRGWPAVFVDTRAGELRMVRGYAYGPGGRLSVTGVSPPVLPEEGGVPVAVTGTGFAADTTVGIGGDTVVRPGTRILIGGRPLREQRVLHDGEIRGIVPPSATAVPAAGASADVVALEPSTRNPQGGLLHTGRSARLAEGVRYVPPGTSALGSVSPATVPLDGEAAVVFSGVGLSDVVRARFGPADGGVMVDAQVLDDGTVWAVAPAMDAPGQVEVALCSDAAGCGARTLAEGPTYVEGDGIPAVVHVWVDDEPAEPELHVLGGPFPDDVRVIVDDHGEPGADGEEVVLAGAEPCHLVGPLPAGQGDADVIVGTGGEEGPGAPLDVGTVAVRAVRYPGLAPTIAAIRGPEAPFDHGSAEGGERLDAVGSDYVQHATRVFVGECELADVDVDVDASGSFLSGRLPPCEPGRWDVRVETAGGAATLPAAFEIDPPLAGGVVPLSVEPRGGSEEGGTTLVIRGTGLDGLDAAWLDLGGGQTADLVGLAVLSPAVAVGTTTGPQAFGGLLTLATDDGGQQARLGSAFTYQELPRIVGSDPADLQTRRWGGDDVSLDVAGWTSDTLVDVGGLPLADPGFAQADPGPGVRTGMGTVTGGLPPGEPGLQDLRIANGVGVTVLEDEVEALSPPRIDTVTPSTSRPAGGADVVVEGAGFVEGTRVRFGPSQWQILAVVEPTRLEVLAPAGFGVVDVHVTNVLGVGTLEDGFSYLEAPEVASVVPILGPLSGGTLVTLQGRGFGPETEAEIGDRSLDAPAPGLPLLLDPTRLWGRVPAVAAPGWVDVRITDHRGEHLLERAFRYVEDVVVFPAEEVPGPVRALASQRNGTVWAGTDEGLARIDMLSDAVLAAGIPAGVPEAARVNDLAVDDSGIPVAATDGGVAMCKHLAQLVCRTVDHRDLAAAGGVLSLETVALLPAGHLLAGGEVGLVRIDPATQDAPMVVAPGAGGGDGLPGSVVRDLALGPAGTVWIATDAGLASLDLASWAFSVYDAQSTGGGLPDGDVRAVAVGEAGDVWVGTGSGLVRFSPDEEALPPVGERWTTVADLAGGAVTALAVDGLGRVWAGTEAGLARVEGDPSAVAARVGEAEGLPAGDLLAVHAGVLGGIWVGTGEGLVRYAAP